MEGTPPFHSNRQEMEMEFPLGVRFMPTDIELVREYLMNKILSRPLPCDIIHEVDLSLFNPDQLPCMYPSPPGVEGVMYFFTRWKPISNNSSRSSRQAGDGFWKATVGSAAVMDKKTGMILGYKRGLKFYKGPPERAEKTAWLMDEYKIDKVDRPAAATTTSRHYNSTDPWFLCRVHMNKPTKKSSANGPRGQQLQIFQDLPQPMNIYAQNNYLSNGYRSYHCPEQPMYDHGHHQQISDYFDGPIDQTPSSGGNSTVHDLMTVALASDQSFGYGHLITTSSTQDQSYVYDQNDGAVQMRVNCLDDDLTTLEDSTINVMDQYLGQCHAEGPDQPLHDYGHCRISDYFDGPIDQTCTAGGLSPDHESTTAAASNQSLGYAQLTTFTSTYDEPFCYDDVQPLLNCWDSDVPYCESMQFIQDSPMIITAGPC